MASKRFFEPFGDNRRHHLGIHDHPWRITLRKPIADLREVETLADRRASQAHGAAEGGEVDIGKLDQVQWMTMWSEVVDLGSIRGVVVDDDEHSQAEPRDRLEVRQADQCAAVAERSHGQSVWSRDSRADGGGQAKSDGLEGLGEDEAVLVGYAQVHRWIAHEVTGVDRDGPLQRQQSIKRE